MYNETMTQGLSVVDVMNTITTSNNTVASLVGINMSEFHRAMYVLTVGTVTSGQINAVLQSSANSNFNVTHNLAGTTTTNINTNNQIVTLEVRSDEITQANSGDKWLRLAVVANGNTTVSAVGLGAEPSQRPANQYDLNSTYISQRVVSTI